jgi:TonB family protein
VFALRISMIETDFAPDELHYVRIGSSLFGGGLFEPSMGFANSQRDPALRFVVDELLFAELLDAGSIELVATDGASLSVPLVPSALLRAGACIDRHNVPFLDPSDATWRDPLALLRLLPDQQPRLRSNRTRPAYPELAIREGREGATVTAITIGLSGRLTGCRTLRSSGSSDLDASACAAVSTWIYGPATDAEGVPVEVTGAQTVEWRLEQFAE